MRHDEFTTVGVKADGKFTLRHPESFTEAVQYMENGEYAVSVRPLTAQKRSLAQNSRYWLILSRIAETTEHTKDDLHEYMRARFLPAPPFTLVDVNGEVASAPVLIAKSTTSLTVKEFTTYVDLVEQLACEVLGCELLPDEHEAA